MTVGRMRNGFGLHGGVHRDALKLPLIHGLCFHGHGNAFGQQRLQILGPDPLAPACHQRSVDRQLVLEIRLAAEGLKVGVLQPGCAGFLIGKTFHVLEQMQPGHEARWRPMPAFPIMVMRPKRVIEAAPVNQLSQLQQFVPRIENVFQRTPEQIVGPGFGRFRTHRNLTRCWICPQGTTTGRGWESPPCKRVRNHKVFVGFAPKPCAS